MAIVLKRFVDSSYRNTDERHAQYANCPSHLVEFSGPFGNSGVNFSMISGCTNKKTDWFTNCNNTVTVAKIMSQRRLYRVKLGSDICCNKLQEAQLMLTTGSTRLAVSRGQQTWYHFGSIATFR